LVFITNKKALVINKSFYWFFDLGFFTSYILDAKTGAKYMGKKKIDFLTFL
jgi:hypothetical protein